MSKNTLVLDTWVNEFSSFIAKESLSLVKTIGKPKGAKVSKLLASRLLKSYVESLVFESLAEHRALPSPKEAYKRTRENLLETRSVIQEEIAKGFEDAFKKYSGHTVEYYVTINEVPEPKNKEVC